MRVLLTGGTGYLGRAVARALGRRGHHAVIFARSATLSGLSGTLVDGDVRDSDALERAAVGCDAIGHLAALVSIWHEPTREFDEINVGGLRNVLAVTAKLRIPRIVYTSSFLARPPRGALVPLVTNAYQRSKVAGDRLAGDALRDGIRVIRLYPGVVYGPGPDREGNLVGRLIADHLRHRLPGLVGPERTWSFAYVDDVAEAHCVALEGKADGADYLLGGDNVPQGSIFEIVARLTGRPKPRRIPFPLAHAAGLAEELRARVFGGRPTITRAAVEIFRHDWPLDSGAAVRDLGYVITPLAAGIERTVASIDS
jgi:nucleoside-diphosphate-sugar epimerase